MRQRDFGRLGTISALSLGGGGIAGCWGGTDRAEGVATVHAALDAGITALDVAPSYGADHEAERVIGAALRDRPGADVLITSKVELPDAAEPVAARIEASLHASLRRIGRDHLDLFLLHTGIRPADGSVTAPDTIGWQRYEQEAVPVFEKLRAAGTIRAWGITAVDHPDGVIGALRGTPRPDAAQVIVNALDLNGELWGFGDTLRPDNDAIRRAAVDNGVAVLGMRAAAAGALTAAVDRDVTGQPAGADHERAAPFRALAAELGQTPATLAHRYALSAPGVASVILGVKNRAELAECVAAEAQGPLSEAEMAAVLALR